MPCTPSRDPRRFALPTLGGNGRVLHIAAAVPRQGACRLASHDSGRTCRRRLRAADPNMRLARPVDSRRRRALGMGRATRGHVIWPRRAASPACGVGFGATRLGRGGRGALRPAYSTTTIACTS